MLQVNFNLDDWNGFRHRQCAFVLDQVADDVQYDLESSSSDGGVRAAITTNYLGYSSH